MAQVKGRNCRSVLAYSNDIGSGRCRLSDELFFSLGAALGSIVELCFGEVSVLCTAWPTTSAARHDSNEIIFDDTVRNGSDGVFEGNMVVTAQHPSPLINTRIFNSTTTGILPSMLGLPVRQGFGVHMGRYSTVVQSCTPLSGGIVMHSTLLSSHSVKETDDARPARCHGTALTATVEMLFRHSVAPLVVRKPGTGKLVKGVLISGPPGIGKTFAVKMLPTLIEANVEITVIDISIPHILSANNPIRALNSVINTPLVAQKRNKFTAVVFALDEVDALGHQGLDSAEQISVKAYLCCWFDCKEYDGLNQIMVGTCNSVESVCKTLRRGGRFEVEVEARTESTDRLRILDAGLGRVFDGFLDANERRALSDLLVDQTGGFTAADLNLLLLRLGQECKSLKDTDGIEEIIRIVPKCLHAATPSCLRGVSATVPTDGFDAVVGCDAAKRCLRRLLGCSRTFNRERINRFGIKPPGCVLLWGPPGNSKTRLAMAAAFEYGLPLISLSCADVYSPYVGDAEAEIRRAFKLAAQAQPCVLLLDEVDALVANRMDGAGGAESRVLATLLTCMDGIDQGFAGSGVFVIAATNRLNAIDDALLRKGRFHELLHIPSPSGEDVNKLINHFAQLYNLPEKAVDDLKVFFASQEGVQVISGADVKNRCQEMVVLGIRQRVAAMKSNNT